MASEEAKYFNAFNQIQEVGARTFKKLLAGFGSMENAWSGITRARNTESLRALGIKPPVMEKIIQQAVGINPDAEIERVQKLGLNILTINDEIYPKRLKEIYDPPGILYYYGKLSPADDLSIAVVGTRRLSYYGKQVTPRLAYDLAQAGLTIISGMAKGIDTLAHKGALEANGRTLAVIGSGLDEKSIYPRENLRLVKEISQHGAVMSEYPIGVAGLPQHFPARNRIVAGMCLGVLVVEAPEKSGALLTAQHALAQNRDVFAVPGSIFDQNSQGPNNLIKMGAKLVTCAQDVLDELQLGVVAEKSQARRVLADTKEEAQVLEFLSHQPLHIDKLAKLTKLNTSVLSSCLVLMEMKGKVKDLGGMNYVVGR